MAGKVYELVSQRIIAKIKESIKNHDILPWKKPWIYAHTPRNYITQLPYSGVNVLLLGSGEYLTWNQFCDLKKHTPDLKIRKGCHQEMVVYFNFTEKEKEVQNAKGESEVKLQRIPFLKYYRVFNAKDIEGLPSKQKEIKFNFEPDAAAQAVFDNYIGREKITVRCQDSDKACYQPLCDTIVLPKAESFKRSEAFYGTAFHEAVHSTGATARLNRHFERGFLGNEEYSKEELIAEMGSSMLCARLGLLTPAEEKNSVAYMRSWISALSDNPCWLVMASSAAEKAVRYILPDKD